ncbi:pyruvate dehydrogenase E2 component (dihydrolipoamide acetyltransferase) [Weissella uvarum]|uniref:2-oxo acid dehydrogenase subunit E2 n=1 Tax=Weissella uvarum TaxID=1479233 RepID=UPI001960C492|nr:2-oxo acid dehydrogenase subunit E2 [Weissella uvarum]MBM7617417.1 pyruvate dehydrogenase E2 component (dihydrolipoamide acetyltransferase) [Weissella uvarum]MCM0595698.1 2-oxo acid dehydrogenase subunit E2 [Weissella uvarum]
MTEIFKMPDIGEGMTEGEITDWLVKVGDEVKVDDSVAEVQNDKLMQEILSPYSGKVTKLFVEPNTTVTVGDPLIEFDGDGSGAGTDTADKSEATATEPTQTDATAKQNETPQAANQTEAAPVVASNGQILAMPSVRHYAVEHNIDLTQVPATGRHGHITLADVQGFSSSVPDIDHAEQAPATAEKAKADTVAVAGEAAAKVAEDKPKAVAAVAAAHVTEGRQPMSPTRKAIAKSMSTQNATIPSVTNFDSVEVSKLVAHRQAFKETAKKQDVHLTYLAYAVKALAATGKKFPELNASIDMDKSEIIYHDEVNMGIAVSAPNGLYVPVIANADRKSIFTIAKEIAELAEAVRNGTIKPAQMQGATMTISNLGSARGTWFTPIINGHESIILGLGSIVKEPVVNDLGELAVGQNLKLSLTYDHRLIDGMLGQEALNYLKMLLADPAYMLMEV